MSTCLCICFDFAAYTGLTQHFWLCWGSEGEDDGQPGRCVSNRIPGFPPITSFTPPPTRQPLPACTSACSPLSLAPTVLPSLFAFSPTYVLSIICTLSASSVYLSH
ncbi:hypothetical protein K435DRAFT_879371 [Dendrothele bispora CBS 962.96]|uniref:Uncharacterized protein n=1 Tax=Dendrothele bispora (strain CBS 962.96) TaxID=1314807 RepID=A0A4S8KLH1_DENBC|nr:hypothetical protein K435DRAFT_879371 [Dendrothele bispora CBS 962.96]